MGEISVKRKPSIAKTVPIAIRLLQEAHHEIRLALDKQQEPETAKGIRAMYNQLGALIDSAYPVQHGEWFGKNWNGEGFFEEPEFAAYDPEFCAALIGRRCSCGKGRPEVPAVK